MIVEFGICKNDPKTLFKEPTWYTAKVPDCQPYQGCTLLAPRLILAYDPAIVNQNYMRIQEWHRCYYVKFEVIPGGKMICEGSVDPLYSWADYIGEVYATLARGNNPETVYLPDNSKPIKTTTQVENYKFSYTPFNTVEEMTGNYILTVLGGDTV